jgi:cellobiose transport system substrate-binding protein
MKVKSRRRASAVAALLAAALLLAACGGSGSASSGGSAGDGKVTIKVGLFGTFGYKEAGLFDEYTKLHPNITIDYASVEQEANYWSGLKTKLAAGGGLADVQGFEVGRSAEVTSGQPALWTDLRAYAADQLQNKFYPFKWSGGTTSDGKVLGLGTDIGPMAMCYRKDLLGKAGLPTDRDALGKAWATWDQYFALGNQYQAKAGNGEHWLDSAGSVYGAVLGQQPERYYDATTHQATYATNASIKQSWDRAMATISQGLTAKLAQFTPPWNQAFSTGAFATIACPAWMLGYIKGQAGDKGSGKWDIASLPGGSGNWGGSYLGIPAKAKNKKAAADLIMWLTAPAQQQTLFVKQGSFPSSPQAAASSAVADATNAYFSNAPIGKIFGRSAQRLEPQYRGVYDRSIDAAITNSGIIAVEQQGATPEKGWQAAVTAAGAAMS